MRLRRLTKITRRALCALFKKVNVNLKAKGSNRRPYHREMTSPTLPLRNILEQRPGMGFVRENGQV